jgi:hypothetical protein
MRRQLPTVSEVSAKFTFFEHIEHSGGLEKLEAEDRLPVDLVE